MMLRYLQIHLKLMLIGIGILFVSNAYSQSKTDKELYAIWKDKSKPETVRLEAIWERLNIDTLTNKEPEWWKKWKPEVKEAIELAIKNNKKGYLPLLYISTVEDCAGDNDCMCTTANKIIESAKVANDSKLPILFIAYTGLLYSNCSSNIKDEEVINEFNKMKRNLKDNSNDNEMLRQASHQLGEWYALKEKYPKALTYLLESLRISEELQLKDISYARTNERLGAIHMSIGNYKEAEKYIDKSLEVAHTKKDTFQLGSTYLGKSNLMLKLKDEAKAQRYIDSAMYVMKNVKHCEPCYNTAKTLNAGIKNLSKNYSGALAELNEVEAFYNNEGKGQKPEPIFYTEKAKAYLGLKKYNNAIQTINAVKVSEQTYNKEVSDNYALLSKAYEGIGDYNNARLCCNGDIF